MASVSADDVRDVINVTSEEISDQKVLKMIKRAEVTLELETSREIDYGNCSDAEKEFITVLAAVYAICYLTGGSAVGLSFSVGDQNVSVLSKAEMLTFLKVKMEQGLFKMPYDRRLCEQINEQRFEYTKSGQLKFWHPSGSHDDQLWALALACFAAKETEAAGELVRAY